MILSRIAKFTESSRAAAKCKNETSISLLYRIYGIDHVRSAVDTIVALFFSFIFLLFHLEYNSLGSHYRGDSLYSHEPKDIE